MGLVGGEREEIEDGWGGRGEKGRVKGKVLEGHSVVVMTLLIVYYLF